MKKIIIGLLIMSSSPFIIILGSWLFSKLHTNSNAADFASIIGGIAIVVNFGCGIAIMIRGHIENKTFGDIK